MNLQVMAVRDDRRGMGGKVYRTQRSSSTSESVELASTCSGCHQCQRNQDSAVNQRVPSLLLLLTPSTFGCGLRTLEDRLGALLSEVLDAAAVCVVAVDRR